MSPSAQLHDATPLALAFAAVMAAAGCQHGSTLPAAARAASKSSTVLSKSTTSPVTGVWGAVKRAYDSDGDERIDRHEIQLIARGKAISGFWSHSTTWVSRDGRRFRCSGRSRYVQRRRSYLEGVEGPHGVTIRVVGEARALRGAGCPSPTPPPGRCHFSRQANRLIGTCGKQALALNLRLDRPIPVALALGRRGSVTGVWTWHHRSRDRQGDLKIEDEVWHLLQRGDDVLGYYDRLVVVRSADRRPFVCNNNLAYSNLARFRVRGRVVAGRLLLKELDYRTRDGACETGRRVLDSYEGTLDRAGRLIRLKWKRGAQLLYKRY